MRHALLLFAALAVVGVFPAGADEDPLAPNEGPWRIVLKDQLRSEKGCDLNEVLAYQEVPLGSDVGVDGREFNFTRKGRHQKISIEICAPAVC